MLKTILLIGSGGFIGSVARYYVSKINLYIQFLSIPVGTLLVNVLGCFIIGFLTGIVEQRTILTVEWRMFLMVGFCGGFTTFSTFANENLMLLHNGLSYSALLYTGASILLGFTAVYLGFNAASVI
ncbi:MAG: fluoride efflux transporter CrcB [Microbacter sp.]